MVAAREVPGAAPGPLVLQGLSRHLLSALASVLGRGSAWTWVPLRSVLEPVPRLASVKILGLRVVSNPLQEVGLLDRVPR